MSALPKRKLSKGRTRRRRNAYDNLTKITTVNCKKCKSEKISHTVCKECGTY